MHRIIQVAKVVYKKKFYAFKDPNQHNTMLVTQLYKDPNIFTNYVGVFLLI